MELSGIEPESGTAITMTSTGVSSLTVRGNCTQGLIVRCWQEPWTTQPPSQFCDPLVKELAKIPRVVRLASCESWYCRYFKQAFHKTYYLRNKCFCTYRVVSFYVARDQPRPAVKDLQPPVEPIFSPNLLFLIVFTALLTLPSL